MYLVYGIFPRGSIAVFTSVDCMAAWAKQISSFTLIMHFIAVVRLIVLKGSDLADVKMELH